FLFALIGHANGFKLLNLFALNPIENVRQFGQKTLKVWKHGDLVFELVFPFRLEKGAIFVSLQNCNRRNWNAAKLALLFKRRFNVRAIGSMIHATMQVDYVIQISWAQALSQGSYFFRINFLIAV